jgi:hypothetical protein
MTAGPGVPIFVNSVENAGQPVLMGAYAQQAVEATSKCGLDDFSRVGFAHRRYVIRVENAGF